LVENINVKKLVIAKEFYNKNVVKIGVLLL